MTLSKRRASSVVSVLNMKGGVGKTTITAHVFRELYRIKQIKVLLIDIDPQFNLSQALLTEAEYEQLKNQGRTLLSVIEGVGLKSLYTTSAASGEVPEPSSVVKNMKLLRDPTGKELGRLDLLAGDFTISKYALSTDATFHASAQKRFLKFIEKASEEYDLICLDCNPSASFLTNCALSSSSHVLIPVRPDRYSMLGLRMLDSFIAELYGLKVQPKRVVVLNGVSSSNYDPTVENQLRSDPSYGPLTMATVLVSTRLLEARPTFTGFATDKRVPHSGALRRRVASLANELASAFGIGMP